MKTQAHLVISGMVQGVGYRYFTQRQARHLNLTGWVKNLYSGEVEILVEGERSRIEIFIKALRTGNPYATVRNIQLNWKSHTGKYSGFDIAF